MCDKECAKAAQTTPCSAPCSSHWMLLLAGNWTARQPQHLNPSGALHSVVFPSLPVSVSSQICITPVADQRKTCCCLHQRAMIPLTTLTWKRWRVGMSDSGDVAGHNRGLSMCDVSHCEHDPWEVIKCRQMCCFGEGHHVWSPPGLCLDTLYIVPMPSLHGMISASF